MKTLFLLAMPAFLWAVGPIELYYTEDGRKTEFIRGYPINSDLTLSEQGDESWLISVGQQIGPNGYIAKQSKLTLGNLGKKKAVFITMNEDFLGVGQGRRFEHPVGFNDVTYILPTPVALEPFYVKLRDGTEGSLFVAGDYTESLGEKTVQGKPELSIYIIHMKYDVPKSRRTASTRPKQFAIKAKAVSFNEQGIRQAIRDLRDR
jgi:hypothetical protein